MIEECSQCSDGTVSDGKYLCHTSDYRLVDSSDNLTLKISNHDIPSGDDEIGSYSIIKQCTCGHWWS